MGARIDRLAERRFAALALLPGLVLVTLVVVPPVLAVLVLSLFRVELLRDDLRPFVGLRNFLVRLPADFEFLGTIPRTVVFAAVATALAVPMALGSALLVNGRRRAGNALGLLLLLPWAVAPLAAGLFWRLVFDERFGLVNGALLAVGVAPVHWMGEAIPALVVTLVAVVWRATPLLSVLLLGALRAVPRSLAQAARMDGASSWQVLRHITLPAIRPTLLVVCVIQIVLSLQVFDILFAVTSGRPRPGGSLSGYAVYETVINELSFGYGSAQTVVLALGIALCLLPLVPLLRRRSGGVPRLTTEEPAAAVATARVAPRGPSLRVRAGGMAAPALPPAAVGQGGLAARWLPPVAVGAGGRVALRGFAGQASADLDVPSRWSAAVRELSRRVGLLARGAGIVALAAWLAGPMVWLAIASVQPESALRVFPPQLTPQLTFDGYTRLLNDPAWRGALAVSVEVAVGAAAIALFVAVLAGYPLARFRVPGARLLLGALLLTQLIPPIALAIPVLFLFIAIGLKGTVAGLILVNAAFWTPILVWLVRAAFLAVPPSLEAAARMDGAGRLGAILRVALPAAGPAIAAAAVIVFVGTWNDFVFVATMGSRTTSTLPRFLTVTSGPPYHVLAAGILLTIAPCLVLVAALHRRILRVV